MLKSRDKPLKYLGFKILRPSDKLSGFVDCYWFINTDGSSINSKEYLHPDGGTGIILNYGDALQFNGTSYSEAGILCGVTTRTSEFRLSGVAEAVGIRFKPAGASLFLPSSLQEIKNKTVTLADFKFGNYSDLHTKLSRGKTYSDKVSIIENWLRSSLLSNKNISNVVKESLSTIHKHQGRLSIRSVATKTNYHQRRIERLFNSQIGMTPKEYSCILRVGEARFYIKHNKNISFAKIAYDLGYYDQAHFITQFKNVVGISPKEYYRRKWCLSA